MRWLCALLIGGCSFSVGPPSGAADADATADASGDGAPTDASGDAPGIDARPIDAGFDPLTCPSGYTQTLAASPGSRYRWITVDRPWLTHHQDCADDLPGATHLAVLDTIAEAQQLDAASGGSIYYQVGATQLPGQATVSAGWYGLTGALVPGALWHAGQPNDNDGAENGQQDRGSVNTSASSLLQDIDSVFATHGVCECDGNPIAPAVAATL